MKYAVTVEDVEGDFYYDGADVPIIEASTPWVAFAAANDWCKANNVMPKSIHVDAVRSDSGAGE